MSFPQRYNARPRGMGDDWAGLYLASAVQAGAVAGGFRGAVPAGRSFIYSAYTTLNWGSFIGTGEEDIRNAIYNYLVSVGGYENLNVAFTPGRLRGLTKITGKTKVARATADEIRYACTLAINQAGATADLAGSTIAVSTAIPGQYTGQSPIPGDYDDGVTGHGLFGLGWLNPGTWNVSTFLMIGAGLVVVMWLRD